MLEETPRRGVRRWLPWSVAALALVVALFVWNGTNTAWRTPEFGELAMPARATPRELRVLALNVAKASFHHGGLDFAPRREVEARLDAIAVLVREIGAQLVFLSEVVWEGGPSHVNQVRYLAERTGMHAFAYGDNYRFGWPFFRVRSGNAILSRLPLRPLEVVQLPGGAPFWEPTGNRRLLWAEVPLADGPLRIGSVRDDSFDLANNARQARAILDALPAGPVLLAGDFNAEPTDEAMRAFERSGRFLPLPPADPTWPADAPTRRIDHVLVPAGWRLVEYRTLDTRLSDHRPVLAVLRASQSDGDRASDK